MVFSFPGLVQENVLAFVLKKAFPSSLDDMVLPSILSRQYTFNGRWLP